MGLTYSEQGMVKLMNFHQTKGRKPILCYSYFGTVIISKLKGNPLKRNRACSTWQFHGHGNELFSSSLRLPIP